MINKVILVGRLGKDPEVRSTPNRTTVTKFTLATDEKFTDKSGDPSCWVAPPAAYPPGNKSDFPHIQKLDYSKPNGG